MPSTRCQCRTNTGYICKLSYNWIIQDKRYCHVHAKKIFNQKVTIIQSVYRGYKNRQKLNILFKPLPRDIQCMILKYLKEPYYINQYNKSITKVLSNKVEKIIEKVGLNNSYLNNSNYSMYTKYYEDFIYLYDLYSKYNTITDSYYDHQLKDIVHNIWDIFNRQLREGRIFNENNENIVLLDVWHEIHKRLYTSLTRYQNIYNNNYPEFCSQMRNYNNIIL